MEWINNLKRWWYFVNRYTWVTDLRFKCESALRSARKAEENMKQKFKTTDRFEADFREIERDHKILVARSKKMERMVKLSIEFDFDYVREDIQAKANEVRDKFTSLVKALKEQSEG